MAVIDGWHEPAYTREHHPTEVFSTTDWKISALQLGVRQRALTRSGSTGRDLPDRPQTSRITASNAVLAVLDPAAGRVQLDSPFGDT